MCDLFMCVLSTCRCCCREDINLKIALKKIRSGLNTTYFWGIMSLLCFLFGKTEILHFQNWIFFQKNVFVKNETPIKNLENRKDVERKIVKGNKKREKLLDSKNEREEWVFTLLEIIFKENLYIQKSQKPMFVNNSKLFIVTKIIFTVFRWFKGSFLLPPIFFPNPNDTKSETKIN